ncbi:MAG: glycine--tRNA ligase subunit beta [Bacillota bacterium]
MVKNFVFELGAEEIPARFMNSTLQQLRENAVARFTKDNIAFGELQTFGTPRRIVLAIKELAEQQADSESINKGPSAKIAKDNDGNWSKAVIGFARGQGVAPDELIERDGYLYALKIVKGGVTRDLLPQIILDLINGLQFPKTMRWCVEGAKFVRPVHWLVALFGDRLIDIEFAGIKSANYTYGHRFLSSGKLPVTSMASYFEQLWNNSVVVDQNYRKQLIREQITAAALAIDAQVEIDEQLLDEVNFLVEFPTALVGEFEERYLQLPEQAVVTPMKEHQRYFPLRDKTGALLNKFVAVRNGDAYALDIVRKGNERVLRARLADAEFFFNEDRRQPLAAYVPRLADVVYQKGLGSILDKTERIRKISAYICNSIGMKKADAEAVDRAAYLCKADLLTGMVGEFDELQGLMGSVYARASGEPELVCAAIGEHYYPRFSGDQLPQSEAGIIVSIADKIDNICACFSKGLIPTGSQDPYALRRQALSVVLMLTDGELNIAFGALVNFALELLNVVDEKISADLTTFAALRVKNMLTERGIRYDVIEAVMQQGIDYPKSIMARAQTVQTNLTNANFPALLEAYTRVANISKTGEQKLLRATLYKELSDKQLYKAYQVVKKKCDGALRDTDWQNYLDALCEITPEIGEFFVNTMVMVEDIKVRENRLALLVAIRELADKLFTIDKIVA